MLNKAGTNYALSPTWHLTAGSLKRKLIFQIIDGGGGGVRDMQSSHHLVAQKHVPKWQLGKSNQRLTPRNPSLFILRHPGKALDR